MKPVSIIGSTGSIGTQALDVIGRHPDRFRAVALAAGSQIDLLAQQVGQFQPELVSVSSPDAARALKQRLLDLPVGHLMPEIMHGSEGLHAVATHTAAQVVLTSVVGAVGLIPTLAAIAAGKRIALANKETLVAAGELVMKTAEQHGVQIVPVDSEHSALFQCLAGQNRQEVRKLVLTASGGPFRGRRDLSHVTRDEALKHPRWVMGSKITVDSATLMNKALEMIEARWLFDLPMEAISVLVHPESILHSAVEFVDGNLIAQLGPTDMRLPIQYALTYPERADGGWRALDLAQVATLTFEEPDTITFPSLNYARAAVTMGGTMPAVMNAANEVAVQRFLSGAIPFTGIFAIVHETMEQHQVDRSGDLAAILAADLWARRVAASINRW